MEIDWIIVGPILAGVVGLILGYLLGYASKKVPDNRSEIESWQNKYEAKDRELKNSLERRKSLENEISNLQTKLSTVESDLASSNSRLNAVQNIANGTPVINTFDTHKVESAYGKRIVENDLTIIEGIDVEIAALLNSRGINTWKELSQTSADRCRELLVDNHKNYESYQPGTWPDQARLAYEGKWAELRKWQSDHHHTL